MSFVIVNGVLARAENVFSGENTRHEDAIDIEELKKLQDELEDRR